MLQVKLHQSSRITYETFKRLSNEAPEICKKYFSASNFLRFPKYNQQIEKNDLIRQEWKVAVAYLLHPLLLLLIILLVVTVSLNEYTETKKFLKMYKTTVTYSPATYMTYLYRHCFYNTTTLYLSLPPVLKYYYYDYYSQEVYTWAFLGRTL